MSRRAGADQPLQGAHGGATLHRKRTPDPGTYLASTQEGYDDNDYGIPEYDRRIVKLQATYVHRFSPGRRIEVDAPHYMEPVIPDQIAQEVRRVIEVRPS